MRDIFNPTFTYDSAEFELGQRIMDHDGQEYQFVEADAAITANMVVRIATDYGAQGLTTATGAPGDQVAVAKTAIANGDYGWVCIWGIGQINVAASCAANTQLQTTTTAGRLDDADTENVDGIFLTTARGGSAGTAPGKWYYPRMSLDA